MTPSNISKAITDTILKHLTSEVYTDVVWEVAKYLEGCAKEYDGALYINNHEDFVVGAYIGPDGFDEAISFEMPLREVLKIGLDEGAFEYADLLALVQSIEPKE